MNRIAICHKSAGGFTAMAKLEKFECDRCGCYFYVKSRDGFICPNCESGDYNATASI